MRLLLAVLTLLLVVPLLTASGPTRKDRPAFRVGDSGGIQATYGTRGEKIAEFDFEDGLGGPDSQGWVGVDITVQPDTFFHVDDFAGMPSPYAPLSGTKSLWCGVRSGNEPQCCYATAPGYGHNWYQIFESKTFSTQGEVNVTYNVRYDTEPGYDDAYFEYISVSGIWQQASVYTGSGSFAESIIIPADSFLTTTRFRFRFVSDGVWDDQDGIWYTDGAIVVDSLIVSDDTGVLTFEDFEGEAVGALSTVDGDWQAAVPTPFGDYSGLFDATTLVQEDSLHNNTSHVWGFFNGSTDDYSCGGHPGQPVVPFTRNPGSKDYTDYIYNGVESPLIDLALDSEGNPIPVPDSLMIEFDVYRDLPQNNLVTYDHSYQFLVGGSWTPWKAGVVTNFGSTPEWYRYFKAIAVPAGATHLRVRLEVRDGCSFWCGIYGDGLCHSHAPLFDNVAVYVYHPPEPPDFIVTNTEDSGAGSLRQAIADANVSSDRSVIHFDIPGAGPHSIVLSSALPEILYATIIDGYSQTYARTNSAGPYAPSTADLRIELNGSWLSYILDYGLWVGGNESVIRGLVINDFPAMGILLAADDCHIEGNYIGTDVSGTVAMPNNAGITVGEDHTGNVIGGSTPERRNVIAGQNFGVGARSEVRIQGNFIGVGADAVTPLGNTNEGIEIAGATTGAVIGGTAEGEGNLIAYNKSGVSVTDQATACTISGNRIFENNGSTDSLGIDLGGDGLRLANDAGDLDTGPNELQNYPVIATAAPGVGDVRITGSLESTASAGPFALEFFASIDTACGTECQGQRYLGTTDVATDGAGHADFDVTLGSEVTVGELITATATSPGGSTSEFSLPVLAVNTPSGGGVAVEPVDSTTGTSPVELTFDNVTSPGQTTLTTSDTGPEEPGTFIVGESVTYYNLETDAIFEDSVTVCINYDESHVPSPEGGLRLLHYDTLLDPDDWVDVTASVDTLLNVICGRLDHFSPFIMGINISSGIGDGGAPAVFALRQNLPNPFNPTTTIVFDVPFDAGHVRLAIYDVAGRLVRTLVDGDLGPGHKTVVWNGRNQRGQMSASGVYFYRLTGNGFSATKKMVLLK
jgi:hypothetical protein